MADWKLVCINEIGKMVVDEFVKDELITTAPETETMSLASLYDMYVHYLKCTKLEGARVDMFTLLNRLTGAGSLHQLTAGLRNEIVYFIGVAPRPGKALGADHNARMERFNEEHNNG